MSEKQVLTRTIIENDEDYTVALMHCLPVEGAKPHSHFHKQVVYMLSGKGTFVCGGETIQLKAGYHFSIPGNVPHTFTKIEEETTWLEIFVPGRTDF